MAVAAGDLAAARDHYQAALDIRTTAGRRRPRQHRMAARPVRQPQQARRRGGRGRGPGRRPRPPTRPPWTSAPGWPPPTPPTPAGSATCRSATQARRRGGRGRGPGRRPRPLPGRPRHPARLAAADPANTEWQRDLSVSHNKLGDVAVAAGDLAAARDHLPGRPGHRRPAGRRRPRQHRMAARPVGQPQQARGRGGRGRGPGRRPRPTTRPPSTSPTGWPPPTPPTPAGSATCPSATTSSATWRPRPGTWPPPATAYQAALDIADRLAAADPANTGWQRDLSVSHDKLGDVAAAAGDLAAARDPYQAALDIADRLAAADPANTGWQRDLSVSHNKLGDVAAAAGDLAAARDHYQAALDIADPAGRRRPRQHRLAARPSSRASKDRRPRNSIPGPKSGRLD